MNEKSVNLVAGEVILRKPTAGQRNFAMIRADTKEGIKETVMLVELLPLCVKSHPFGPRPVRECLDNLSIEEYDLLVDGLRDLMKPDEELKKKLNPASDQSEVSRTEKPSGV